VYDTYKMSFYAQIYGSNEVYTIFNFTDTISIIPDVNCNLSLIEKRLISKDLTLSTIVILNEGSSLKRSQEIQNLAGLLNEQSLSDQLGSIRFNNYTNLKFPSIYGPLTNYDGVLPVRLKFGFKKIETVCIYSFFNEC
jgi:hypothetical protein